MTRAAKRIGLTKKKKARRAIAWLVSRPGAWCPMPGGFFFLPLLRRRRPADARRAHHNTTPQNENGRRTPPDLANLARGSTCDNVAQRNPWADFRLRRKGGLEWEEFERNGTVPTGTVVVVKSNEVRETSAVTADQRRPLSPLMGPLAPSGIALVSW